MPFVVPGLSASSSSFSPSSTSSSSSSQDSVLDDRYTENPAPERRGSTSEELRGDPLHESAETIKESKDVQRDLSHELHDWLQEFRENLGDESTSLRGNPEQRSPNTSKSLRELPMEPRPKVEPGSG